VIPALPLLPPRPGETGRKLPLKSGINRALWKGNSWFLRPVPRNHPPAHARFTTGNDEQFPPPPCFPPQGAGGGLDHAGRPRLNRAEDEMYITGRVKTASSTPGLNLYRHEIEDFVAPCPRFAKIVAVFGSAIPRRDRASLVVGAETRERIPAARTRIAQDIPAPVSAAMVLPPDVILRSSLRTHSETSSGKLSKRRPQRGCFFSGCSLAGNRRSLAQIARPRRTPRVLGEFARGVGQAMKRLRHPSGSYFRRAAFFPPRGCWCLLAPFTQSRAHHGSCAPKPTWCSRDGRRPRQGPPNTIRDAHHKCSSPSHQLCGQ